MAPTHVLLSEVEGDTWRRRIVSGAALGEVERWLADVEARPRLPGPVSGKPLAWLDFTVEAQPGHMQTVRSVGLLTDVGRVLDRAVSAQDLEHLTAIFDRRGQPYTGTIER